MGDQHVYTQEAFELRIDADLAADTGVAAVGNEAGAIGDRVIAVIGAVVSSAKRIIAEFPGKIDDATFAFLLAAAKKVLSVALGAFFPQSVVDAALVVLEAIINLMRGS